MCKPAVIISEMLLAIGSLLTLFTLVAAEPEAPPKAGELLYAEDFRAGLSRWTAELEKPGIVKAKDGLLVIDVPAGCTVWFRPELKIPVMIRYLATLVRRGGPNDRVSDLNCFWMARDTRSPDNFFAAQRSGKFADYNQLLAYYVGQGGNYNTTTRFRRYIGDPELRPLLPEHDLTAPLLEANTEHEILVVADGKHIQYFYDGKVVFDFKDPEPYRQGRFGLRTTFSHLEIRDFRVYRVKLSR
jgi:hypothetical protein